MTRQPVLPDTASVLAIKETLENLGGDPLLLQELLDFFLEFMPTQLDDLASAVAARDPAGVDLQAHSMKGSAANVGAVQLAALARELEVRAKSGNLAGVEDLVVALRQAFTDLRSVAQRIDWTELD